jgi:hypothetical protein
VGSEAGTGDDHDVGLVGEAIQARRGQQGIAEQVGPLLRRVVADESPAGVSAALHDLAQRVCPLPLSIRVLQKLLAFLRAPDTPWLRQLAEWSGQEPAIAPFGTNAWAYPELARECVVLGPGSIQ